MKNRFFKSLFFSALAGSLFLTSCNSDDSSTGAIDDNGNGYSKYKNLIINRYKPGYEISQGINFWVKDLKTKKVKKITFLYLQVIILTI